MSIYKNQSILIELDTRIDISTGSAFAINYRKPSGTLGSWTATRDGEKVVYTTNNTDLDEEGTWFIQAYVIISALNHYGKEVKLKVLTL